MTEEKESYQGPDRRQYVDTSTCLARQQAIINTMESNGKVLESEVKGLRAALADLAADIKQQGEDVRQLHDQLLVGNGSEAIKVQVAQNTAFREEMMREQALLQQARRSIWAAVLVAVISGGFTIWATVIGKWP